MSKSIELTLTFEAERDGDEMSITLISIKPKGKSTLPKFKNNCCHCQAGEKEATERRGLETYWLCDACAIEEEISCVSPADFLDIRCNIKPTREGRFSIKGQAEWHTYHTVNGVDYDEEFHVKEEIWHHE